MSRRWPRALWRMAGRDLRRHAGRSVLIVALVGLPVAGLSAGTVLLRAATVSGQQRATQMMGTAALRVDGASPRARFDQAALPRGSRTVSFSTTDGVLRVGPGDARRIELTDQPLGDPLTAGMLPLDAGRAPTGPDEIAVSAAVLHDLGRRIGDPLPLLLPERAPRITGTVTDPADVNALVAVTGRGAVGPTARPVWLIALPGGAADRDPPATGEGLSVTTREQASQAPSDPSRAGSGTGRLNLIPIVAGLALMIAALVAAAAFAAGVRREVRELGLLAAAGASPTQLRASVLARGATLGLAGGVAGLALGLLAAVAVHPSLDRIVGHLPNPVSLPALQLLGVAAAAVLAGTAAALLPARFAARVPPVEALAARVPAGPPPRRAPSLGVLAVIVGCALAATGALPRISRISSGLGVSLSLTGLAILLGGFVACSAALVAAVEPLAPRLPLAGRVAARQAARNRSRTGPAIAAITMALAVPIIVASATLTAHADDRVHWLPELGGDQLRISTIGRGGQEPSGAPVRAVLAAVPGAVAAPLRQALAGGDRPIPVDVFPHSSVTRAERPGGLFVGGEDLMAALGAGGATADLAAGKVVGVGQGTVDGGQVALHAADFRNGKAGTVTDPRAKLVPATQVDGRPLLGTIRYAISAAEARRRGLVTEPQGMLVRAPHTLTAAELQAMRAALAPYSELTIDAGPGAPPASVSSSLLALMFGVSAAVALAVVAAMVGLAQAEAGPERRTLFAVGASPSVLRRTAAASAGLLALLGGLLAVPAALLPLAAMYAASPAAVPLVVPWAGLAVCALLFPALAAAGGAALTRTRPRTRPRSRTRLRSRLS